MEVGEGMALRGVAGVWLSAGTEAEAAAPPMLEAEASCDLHELAAGCARGLSESSAE